RAGTSELTARTFGPIVGKPVGSGTSEFGEGCSWYGTGSSDCSLFPFSPGPAACVSTPGNASCWTPEDVPSCQEFVEKGNCPEFQSLPDAAGPPQEFPNAAWSWLATKDVFWPPQASPADGAGALHHGHGALFVGLKLLQAGQSIVFPFLLFSLCSPLLSRPLR